MIKTSVKLVIRLLFIIAVGCIFVSCTTVGNAGPAAGGEKPVILIAAFGSSYESGRKNLEDFDTAVREAFPDTEVYWGFTAGFIVKKLQKKGVEHIFERKVALMTIEEAFDYLRAAGKKNVLVQNLFMMVGQEYRQTLDIPTRGLNVKYSHPMLYYPENIRNIIMAVEDDFGDPEDTVTILCAHGNAHYLEYNAELLMINDYLIENYKNTFLAVMEGVPGFDRILKEIEGQKLTKVKFITLMLTYGDHMSNDAMGDEEDSWKVKLGIESCSATPGLASHTGAQMLFINNMKNVIAQFN